MFKSGKFLGLPYKHYVLIYDTLNLKGYGENLEFIWNAPRRNINNIAITVSYEIFYFFFVGQ